MPWFPTILEWAPPADHAGERPFPFWSDTQQLTVLWFDRNGTLCRQDFLVDPATGTIDPTDQTIYDTADPIANQRIIRAAISPTGELMIQTEEMSSG